MKGFKNSTRMRSGFNFSSSGGYTGSTGNVQNISYTRKTPRRGPAKFAHGGKIDSPLHSFKGDSQLNVEYGPTGGLRPGFTRGGYASKYAEGGKASNEEIRKQVGSHSSKKAPPPKKSTSEILRSTRKEQMADLGLSKGGKAKRMGYAKGGSVSPTQAKKIAEKTVGEHVRYPAPEGHKGLKSC